LYWAWAIWLLGGYAGLDQEGGGVDGGGFEVEAARGRRVALAIGGAPQIGGKLAGCGGDHANTNSMKAIKSASAAISAKVLIMARIPLLLFCRPPS
jgi:hypothetical protein